MIFFNNACATVTSRSAMASHHQVRYFVMTRMYLFPVFDVGKGPMISHPTSSKDSVTCMGIACQLFVIDPLLPGRLGTV